MNREIVLQVKDLRTEFHTLFGVVQAVRGVSFEVRKSETIGIVGESGCGKSVTGLSILKLIPNPPGKIVSGEVVFKDENIFTMNKERLNQIRGNAISMIFQDPISSLNPVLTIRTQMMESILYHTKKSKEQALNDCIELLNQVKIRSPKRVLSQYPHQLSGGMRQRIMIAIALSCDPEILIADEPTTSLDVTVQAQIMELMRELQKNKKTAIILITHNLAVVAGMCERVLVFYAGKIVEDSPIEALYKEPLHPYTIGLLKAIPNLKNSSDIPLQTITGSPPDLISPPPGCSFHPRCDFAMNICAQQEPPLYLSEGRSVACWLYDPRSKKKVR
jgi:oligopeptide transport system ATP-binding protein